MGEWVWSYQNEKKEILDEKRNSFQFGLFLVILVDQISDMEQFWTGFNRSSQTVIENALDEVCSIGLVEIGPEERKEQSENESDQQSHFNQILAWFDLDSEVASIFGIRNSLF